jgi:hypothetical protein
MTHYTMDNGEYMMRAMRAALQQQALQQQQNPYLPYLTPQQQQNPYLPYLTPRAWTGPVTPGERPEPEDITGLRLLEQFLAKRKGERDGDERK